MFYWKSPVLSGWGFHDDSIPKFWKIFACCWKYHNDSVNNFLFFKHESCLYNFFESFVFFHGKVFHDPVLLQHWHVYKIVQPKMSPTTMCISISNHLILCDVRHISGTDFMAVLNLTKYLNWATSGVVAALPTRELIKLPGIYYSHPSFLKFIQNQFRSYIYPPTWH